MGKSKEISKTSGRETGGVPGMNVVWLEICVPMEAAQSLRVKRKFLYQHRLKVHSVIKKLVLENQLQISRLHVQMFTGTKPLIFRYISCGVTKVKLSHLAIVTIVTLGEGETCKPENTIPNMKYRVAKSMLWSGPHKSLISFLYRISSREEKMCMSKVPYKCDSGGMVKNS